MTSLRGEHQTKLKDNLCVVFRSLIRGFIISQHSKGSQKAFFFTEYEKKKTCHKQWSSGNRVLNSARFCMNDQSNQRNVFEVGAEKLNAE